MEVNITVELKETRFEGVAWDHSVLDGVQWRALVNTMINLRVP
jgi:hypothetical protein